MTVTWKTVAIAAGVSLALGGAGGYLARPQPTVHRVEDDHQVRDAQAEVDSKTALASERITVTDFAVGPGFETPVFAASDEGKKPDAAARQRMPTDFSRPIGCPEERFIRKTVIERGPATTETHAQAREHAEADRKLDLTITPPARPGWAVQVGLDNVFARSDLRLELRRRLIGPFWVGASVVPDRLQLGASVTVEW